MNLSFFIARRYFLSRKKKNFINVISVISMGGVAIGTMALVIVLSVFNGLEDLLRSLYGAFDPEIKIEATNAKSFEVTDEFIKGLRIVEGVQLVTQVAEDYAYVKYRNAEMAVIVKGVEDNFIDHGRMEHAIFDGEFKLKDGPLNYAIVGMGVRYTLSMDPANEFEPMQIHYVKNVRIGITDPGKLVNKRNILPGAYFALEKQLDETYIIVPLDFALDLFNYTNKRTSLEVKTNENYSVEEVQQNIREFLGNGFSVLNSDQQHATLLRTVRIEKIFVYVIFSFILAVASFNIFFSLTMLALDKKKDISVLFSLGATNQLIRRIFLYEGALVSFIGATLGLLAGWIIGWTQENYGIVSMGMETAILQNYPIKMEAPDFLYTGISIVLITLFASYRPAIIATRFNSIEHLQ